MTDWQQNISEQSKEVVEINSEIFPSDGSLNCAVTGTKEEKHWHAKCFKSYVTGCLYCKELLCTRMSYSLLCFTLMEKGNPQAQTWLWIFPVVVEALSGASYIILYLSHIPMWMSALPCEKSQEKGTFKRRNNFYKDKLFPTQGCKQWHADIVSSNLWCSKWSQLKQHQIKIFEQLCIF